VETARTWLKLKTDLVPGAEKLRDFRDELENVLDLLDTLVDVADTAEILVLLATDPISAVLAAGISIIESSLNEISRLGASCIVIPAMTSQTVPPDYDNLSSTNFALGANRFDDPQTLLSPDERVDSPINAFFEVFAASLEDRGDVSRPQYPDDHYVGGIALLVGAPNAIELLRKIALLESLWSKLITQPMDFGEIPRPKNLTALAYRPVMGPIEGLEWSVQDFLDGQVENLEQAVFPGEIGEVSVGDSNFAVVLRWDGSKIGLSNVFTTLKFDIQEVRLYVKEGSDFTASDRGEKLEELQLKRFMRHATSVTLTGLDDSKVYYAAVGYKVVVREYDVNGNIKAQDTLEHYAISNSVRIAVADDEESLPQGELPDWVGVNSPLDIAPPVKRLLQRAQQLLLELKNNIVGTKVDEYREFIALIRKRIATIRSTYVEFLELYDDLVTFLELLSVDLYVYAFAGKGGTRLLSSEMWHALLDPRTKDKPAFNDQASAVTGLVMVAGAPSLDGLGQFMSLLGLLVGDSGVRQTLGNDLRTRVTEVAFSQTSGQLDELDLLVGKLESRRDAVLEQATDTLAP